MKPFFHKVRQQVAFVLVFASVVSCLHPSASALDQLDETMALAQSAKPAPLISRSVMLRRQQIREVHMSTDGKWLAYVVSQQKFRELWLLDIETDEHRHLFSSKLMNDIEWSTDSQYIFTVSGQGLAAVPLAEASSPAFVINLEQAKDQFAYGVDRTQPHAFIVSLLADDRNSHGLYRVFPDGTKTELYRSENRAFDFELNSKGNVAVVRRAVNNQFDIVKVSPNGEEVVLTCDKHDHCSFQRYDEDTDTLYLRASLGADLIGLYSVNLSTGEKKLLHSDPKDRHDLQRLVLAGGKPVLAQYVDDYLSVYGLSPDVEEIRKIVAAKLKSPYLSYRPSSNLRRWLIIDGDPSSPTLSYYVYDALSGELTRPLAEVAQELLAERPMILPAETAPRIPVHYTVSDGMRQQGYVTLPRGAEPAKVPLVVVPHGGPWGRRDGSYNALAQFLANRGYAVFEPNFRSSTGFGHAYVKSANKNFGKGRVQQDILDGMAYILARGIGDKDKLAMVGHSFGGFSALGALSFTPGLFKVGFAGAAPVDLVKSIRNFRENETSSQGRFRYEIFRELAVNLEDPKDVARLSSQSPDAYWEHIEAPLYMWAGEQDPKVNILNVREYALRLSNAGKRISYLAEPSAGHSPRDDLHIEAYYYMIEKALADHLGGRMERDLSPSLRRYLRRSVVLDHNDFTPMSR
ncbi:MAG: alpha/beta fold hydrolase [Kordiimonas sp.]